MEEPHALGALGRCMPLFLNMLKLSPLNPTQSYYSEGTNVSLLKSCKTPKDLKQLHASTVKSAIFRDISVSSQILALYSNPKMGNLDYAKSVFNQISEPNSLCWNTMIKCYVENQRSHDAIRLFYELLYESRIPPDNFTFPCVIKGCAQLQAVEEGKQIHGLVLKSGFDLDVFVESSLVSLYSKCGQIGLAREIFERMDNRDLVSWNTLIDGYAKCGEVEIARQLFDEMPERDSFSWTVLVNGYSKCGKVGIARECFDRMPERTVVSWNAMIDGYMKCGDVEMAKQLFHEMQERNIVTWNSIIVGYGLNGKFMEAVDAFQAMLKSGSVPNNATLVGALSAASGIGLLEKGRWIHSYMGRNDFKLNGVLGTSLIDTYSKCGSIESALKVFHAIPKKRVGHWTAIIVGLGMHGMADCAIRFFEEMKRSGMKPHAITFVGLLNACSHAGMVDEGCQYFKLMIDEYGIKPTIEHYGCLVDLLCRAGHLEEAKDVIEKMPMRCNEVIWMSLISGCRNHENIDIGEYAGKRMIELAPKATGSYVLLSNIYAAAGQWGYVAKLREMMKKRGLKKDPGFASIEHEGRVHNFIVGDKSHPQTESIYSKLNEMGKKLKCVGYNPDTTQVLLCIEERDKEVELAHHSERLAIAFGLINTKLGSCIRVLKNLRVCNDCHVVIKLLSDIYKREIIVRDNSRFHHFKNGLCSCKDYW